MTARNPRPPLQVQSTGVIQTEVERALRKLPSKWPGGHVTDFHAMAEEYEYLVLPDVPDPPKSETIDQLKAISEKAEQLLFRVMKMQGPAVEALQGFQWLPSANPAVYDDGDAGPMTFQRFKKLRSEAKRSAELDPSLATDRRITLGELARALDRLSSAADMAQQKLEGEPPDKRRPDSQMRGIAKRAAQDYFELTGNNPTLIVDSVDRTVKASGPFLVFLSDIFKAYRLDVSIEYQARLVTDEWNTITEETEKSQRPISP